MQLIIFFVRPLHLCLRYYSHKMKLIHSFTLPIQPLTDRLTPSLVKVEISL